MRMSSLPPMNMFIDHYLHTWASYHMNGAWWNCQHPFQVSSTRHYNFWCNYATPKDQVGYCSSFLFLHVFPWKREPMEIFNQKYGRIFPKKSKMSQIYKRKKILKFSPFFSEKNKICQKKITGHHKVIIHLQWLVKTSVGRVSVYTPRPLCKTE